MIAGSYISFVLLLLLFLIVLFNFFKLIQEKTSLQKLINEKNKIEDSILNLIPKPIFIVDITGNYLNINKYFEEFFSVEKTDIVGKSILSFNSEELKKIGDVIDTELKRLRKYGFNAVTPKTLDVSIRSKQFKIKHIKITKSYYLNDKGKISGFVGIIEDVTEQEKKINDLTKKAILDELTMIYNRRHFNLVINKEIERAKRYKQNLSLIMFDIDFFKKINDTYGHQVGDYVLKRLCNIVKKSIRTTDFLFRIGGEEFAVILPNTELKAAETVAEKLRYIVENAHFDTVKNITISVGVTEFKEDDDMNSFYKRCDQALYKAKEDGRNRVVSSSINL